MVRYGTVRYCTVQYNTVQYSCNVVNICREAAVFLCRGNTSAMPDVDCTLPVTTTTVHYTPPPLHLYERKTCFLGLPSCTSETCSGVQSIITPALPTQCKMGEESLAAAGGWPAVPGIQAAETIGLLLGFLVSPCFAQLSLTSWKSQACGLLCSSSS